MSVPKEARLLYLAAEIYLRRLDSMRVPPNRGGDCGEAWQRGYQQALRDVQACCALSQLRITAARMLPLIQADPAALRELKEDLEAARTLQPGDVPTKPGAALAHQQQMHKGLDRVWSALDET